MANPIVLPDEKPYPEFPSSIDSAFGDFSGKPANNTQSSGNENNFWNTDVGKEMAANQAANKANQIPMPIGYSAMSGKTGSAQSTMADKPMDYTSPEEIKAKQYGSAAAAGLAQGGNMVDTPDATDAAIQVGSAGLSGAASGLAVGGLPGAAIGGILGLVSGGINAWVGTHSARQNRRQQEKVAMQIQAREDARREQDRQDQLYMFNSNKEMTLEQLRYNRRASAVQESFQAQEQARRTMNDAIAGDKNLKEFFLRTGR